MSHDDDLGTLLDSVAGHGVSDRDPPSVDALDPVSWSEFRRALGQEGLIGFAAELVETRAWTIDLERREELASDHARAAGWVLVLERLLLELDGWFGADGIEYRVLKGSAYAHLDYPDPALRCHRDLDILVSPDSFERAEALIRSHGGRRRFPEPRAGFDREFSKGAAFSMPSGAEVDLHRTLTLGWFGLAIPSAGLMRAPATFSVGTMQLPALPLELRLVHACIHAALGDATPSRLAMRDVAQLAVHLDDVDSVEMIATEWRSEVVIADALFTTWQRLRPAGTPALLEWSQRYDPSWRERRRLQAYQGPRRSHARLALSGVSAVPGVRARLRYLFAVLLPRRHPRRIPTSQRLEHGLDAIRLWFRR